MRAPGRARGVRRRGPIVAAVIALLAAPAAWAENARPRGDSQAPAASQRSAERSGSSASRSRPSARDTRPRQESGGRTVVHRDRRPTGRGSSRVVVRWTPYWYDGGWYGYWGPYFYWGPVGWGYSAAYPHGGYRGYRGYGGDFGALDLDVSPEKAEIYIDGQYVGVADRYDGFPSYLWLEEGTYDVVIYKEGFRTIARQITIYPGLVIDIEDRMERGESVRPEDLASTSTERRDARLRREAERQAEAAAQEAADAEAAEEWRERRAEPVAEEPMAEPPMPPAAGAEPGRLSLEVTPLDASVYLDGRFVGTAEELARLASSLVVEAGEHVLEVVRPGYRGEARRFTAAAGDEIRVRVDLSAQE